jgi:hypothetical protein
MPDSGSIASFSGYDTYTLSSMLLRSVLSSSCAIAICMLRVTPKTQMQPPFFQYRQEDLVCRLSGLEIILSMHDMARRGLKVSLVGENRSESSLRLTPL